MSIPDEGQSDDLGRELERLDKLLNRGLDEISDIELNEIIQGVAGDEPELQSELSAISSIKRSAYSQANNIGGLVFEEQIQFIVENDIPNIDDIPAETLQQLRTVPAEAKLAEYTVDEKSRKQQSDEILKSYNEAYQKQSGVSVRYGQEGFVFHAARPGKVVLYKNRIYLVAADRDATCRTHVAQDAMEACIDCFPAVGNGRKLKVSEVFGQLEKDGVSRGVVATVIEKTVETVNAKGLSVLNVAVAFGHPPCHGKDSTITIHFPTEVPDIGFTILPDGKIDYKKQAPIKMVTSSELLATVSEPEPGIDGYNVFGEPLPAKQGEVDDILEGENVRRSETGDSFYAECSGIVSFHEKVLSVYPHYQVEGDVDMHSGNINFNGSVTVLGNVKSGFEVKAVGDIFIAGSTEAATIEAGRDIRINGAAVGGNETVIKSGRNIFAGHVQNARIEAQGDIIIVRSVMHSQMYSTGKVILHDRSGSIVGGMVNAMRGIEAMSIGSHIGTHTEVVVGSDFLVQRKKTEIQGLIRFYEANLSKIDMVLKPLMAIVKKGIPLGSEKKRRLGSIIDKRFNIVKQLRIIQRHLSELSDIAPDAVNATVSVQKTLFQDVTIKIGTLVHRTNEDLRGVQCKISSDRKKIILQSISSSLLKTQNSYA